MHTVISRTTTKRKETGCNFQTSRGENVKLVQSIKQKRRQRKRGEKHRTADTIESTK